MAREGTRSARRRSATPTTTEEAKANMTSNAEETASKTNETPEQQHHPLARVEDGMNRRSLLTGLYGPRGERVRHVVANGALLLPEESLDIMASFGSKQDDDLSSKSKGKKRKTHQLPTLDSVVRPSADKSLKKIVVTDVFHKHFPHATDPTQPPTLRTVAANRQVDVMIPVGNPETERIRGGGDEENPAEAAPAPALQPPQVQPAAATGNAETQAPTTGAADASNAASANPNASAEETQVTNTAPGSDPVANNTITQAVGAMSEKAVETVGTATQAPSATQLPAVAPAPAPEETSGEKKAETIGTTAQTASGTQVPAVPPAPAPAPVGATTEKTAETIGTTTQTASGTPVPAMPPAPAPSNAAAPAPPQTTSSSTNPAPTVPAPAASSNTPVTPTKTTSSEPPAAPTSAVKPAEAATDKVIALSKKPEPQWEQHVPSANDENLTDPQAKSAKSDWYNPETVSNLERTLLPEWFDESASHRTEETYLKARETMIHISKQLGNRYVTSTLARRSLPGDVGSLHRLHNFLTSYLWINEEGRNDSAPTAPSLQQPPQTLDKEWNDKRRGDLIEAVVEAAQANKKQKTEDAMEVDGDEFLSIDWDAVSKKVGSSAGECEREFLAMQLDEASVATTAEPQATPDATVSEPARRLMSKDEMAQDELIRSLVEESSPRVIRKVTEAALVATNHDLPAAQKAARLGLIASQAASAAQGHEETVSRLLSEVLDQRMQKLECRMALMDDLEGMLEAERVALELERRDLYTTRCRDWFGNA